MKIVLATSNLDKVKEIKEFLKGYEIYALSEVVKPFEIVEDGSTFQQNALIKSRAVFAKLKEQGLDSEFISLSDDSGISVDALGGVVDPPVLGRLDRRQGGIIRANGGDGWPFLHHVGIKPDVGPGTGLQHRLDRSHLIRRVIFRVIPFKCAALEREAVRDHARDKLHVDHIPQAVGDVLDQVLQHLQVHFRL